MPTTRQYTTTAFLMIFVIVGFGILCYGVYTLNLSRVSFGWPTADGVITHATITREDRTWHANVDYRFSVNGDNYNGNRITLWDYGVDDPSHAQSIVNKYPEGTKVRIYYMKKKPETCILEPGIKGSAWFVAGLGLVFVLVGTRFIVLANRRIRQ